MLFFVLLSSYDQILFDGPYPIFFPEYRCCLEISAYQFLNGFLHYLSFLTSRPYCAQSEFEPLLSVVDIDPFVKSTNDDIFHLFNVFSNAFHLNFS